MNPALIILFPPAALVAVAVGSYNHLTRLRNRCRNAFAQIDVQLQRRHDLIPNFIAAARGYLVHEREALESLALARGRAVDARESNLNAPSTQTRQSMDLAEGQLARALQPLVARAEANPELKADGTMAAVMEELLTTENRIALARQAYNDAVMFYNAARESFPDRFVTSWGAFAPAAFFLLESESERNVPQVNLA